MKEKILITGGAGFIGSHLALHLLELGKEIVVLDNLSPQIHGNPDDSPLYQSIKDKVEFINGDVRNYEDWEKALENVQKVVHLAAETGTGQSMYEIQKYIDVNCGGTGILLDVLANRKHQVRKVVIASSRAVYGEGKYSCSIHGVVFPESRKDADMAKGEFQPKCPECNADLQMLPTTEDSKIHPASVYGITKQFQEQSVLNVCDALGIDAIALRYQNVYGPGQSLKNPYTGILSIFSTQMLNGNPVTIFEDGEESRDFVYIDDVVRITAMALDDGRVGEKCYNVGSGKATSVLAVAEKLKSIYNSDVEIKISGNYRIGDIRHNIACVDQLKNDFKISQLVSFEEGITHFGNWVKQQEIQTDLSEQSMIELREKGLYK
ncbi:SDR family NAD(P)-dependent oxidoreductase [Chryseobacterium suipulveris]|uniref:SDR family NAD(P)-dependent oxidoreductase n=1 Tax=Chryseobacterium suipulveris TaxID=2929800 RepID=A0ABY4BUZ5_9FLAO|nr:NAD-dependent epimerase/dehydratase family protein [Chryseobacterium suipulveris]UOE41518.1 SDR family NAD(P)-dependent oxidoreductase [Chryseobacterium suipulveris]